MNTQISSKLVAFATALVMNSVLVGSVAWLFDGQIHQLTAAVSVDRAHGQGLRGIV